jgi:hypothetical protein
MRWVDLSPIELVEQYAYASRFSAGPSNRSEMMAASAQDKQRRSRSSTVTPRRTITIMFAPQAGAHIVEAFVRLTGLARRGGRPRLRVRGVHALLARALRVRRARHRPAAGRQSARKYPDIAFVEATSSACRFPRALRRRAAGRRRAPLPTRRAARRSSACCARKGFLAFDQPDESVHGSIATARRRSTAGRGDRERASGARREVAAVFARAGFSVSSHYLADLAYRYVASPRAQLVLPIYNFIDAVVFGLTLMERRAIRAHRRRQIVVMTPELDIVIPISTGPQHRGSLAALQRSLATPARADLLRPSRRHAAGDPPAAGLRRPCRRVRAQQQPQRPAR